MEPSVEDAVFGSGSSLLGLPARWVCDGSLLLLVGLEGVRELRVLGVAVARSGGFVFGVAGDDAEAFPALGSTVVSRLRDAVLCVESRVQALLAADAPAEESWSPGGLATKPPDPRGMTEAERERRARLARQAGWIVTAAPQ